MQIQIKHKQLEDADLTDALFKEMQISIHFGSIVYMHI
jgi:hypothetical protein